MAAPAEPIDIAAIQRSLPHYDCQWVERIASTQQAVKRNQLLVAETQTGGVGRRGKQWLSPQGRAICFSWRFTTPLPPAQLGGFQMVAALAVHNTLQNHHPQQPIQLKWPNDIYSQNRKLAGILIHLIPGHAQADTEINTGIGINWCLTPEQLDSIDQPVANVPLNPLPDRASFIIELVQTLEQYHQLFVVDGLLPFLAHWQQHDMLLGHQLSVAGAQVQSGRYQGINPEGQLMLETGAGLQCFNSGEVSIKRSLV